MNKKNAKILVCTHKLNPNIREGGLYLPIHAGKALSKIDLGYIGDDTGDNISTKNTKYCELTTLYWAWKNLKEIDYIGLTHYRRYFDMDLTIENIDNILLKKNIILVKPRIRSKNNIETFSWCCSPEDVHIFLDTLLDLYPEYKDAIIMYGFHSNKCIQCNMFISQWDLFDDYCNILFTVLSKVENRIKEHSYTRQNRSLAYLGEFFLGLYVYHRKLKIKYVDMVTPEEKKTSKIHKIISNSKCNISFFIQNISLHKVSRVPLDISVKVGLLNDGITLNSLEKFSK